MRAYRIGVAAAGVLAVSLLTQAPPVGAQASREVTAETVAQWMTDLSNWGRWGGARQESEGIRSGV